MSSTVIGPSAIRTAPAALTITRVPGSPPAVAWAREHRDEVRRTLAAAGALLVRGLQWDRPEDIGLLTHALGSTLMAEREGFAPRRALPGGTYQGSEWPPDQPMCLHHELSYRLEVPSLMIVGCRRSPASGGATPVADARAVLADLPPDIVEAFDAVGWTLARTFGADLGVSATEAFGTGTADGIAAYCALHGIDLDPQTDGVLRTRQRRTATTRRPGTGERVWFNQIAFLNSWTMDPAVRDYLVDTYGAHGLPFDTSYGDGRPVERDTVDRINDCYQRHAVREPWQRGDVLLVDNIRTAHGRDPYTGDRDVVVALADPVVLDTDRP
jgi:Taurine catabolism dioxygenase TauD, TfdA family